MQRLLFSSTERQTVDHTWWFLSRGSIIESGIGVITRILQAASHRNLQSDRRYHKEEKSAYWQASARPGVVGHACFETPNRAHHSPGQPVNQACSTNLKRSRTVLVDAKSPATENCVLHCRCGLQAVTHRFSRGSGSGNLAI